MGKKPKTFGTREWAKETVNCCRGCSNDCWYCYARANAARFGRCKPEDWHIMEEGLKQIPRFERMRYPTRVMFPSSHDIVPEILDTCMETIFRLLKAGHAVLIVSKPRMECMERIVEAFPDYRRQLLFRFSIGACDDYMLRQWEPGAPDLEERVECLKLCYKNHFATSVSCEPVLDTNTMELLSRVGPWISTTFWIGTANFLKTRLSLNHAPADIRQAGRWLEAAVSPAYIHNLYGLLRTHSGIRWKDSCKKILGLRKGDRNG